MPRQYTDEEKLAYYKKRVAQNRGAPKRKAPARSSYAKKAPVKKVYASRSRRMVSGDGDYLVSAPKSLRYAPKSLGGTIGAYLGHGIHTVVKALTGFGDYQVQENSLIAGTIGGDPPGMRNTPGGMIIRHREFIQDITSASVFTNHAFSINPGLLQTFPWLHQIADSFEQYRFRGLVFEYKTMSSNAVLSASASTALGTIIMGTQYNALDPSFVDKRTMENYEFSNSCSPDKSMMHPIECKMSQTSVAELYVRNDLPSTGDLRLYDLGNFQIAVQGMQGTTGAVIGELWCTFEIEFYKPKLLTDVEEIQAITDHYQAPTPVLSPTNSPLGGVSAPTVGSTIGTSLVQQSGYQAIVFPNDIEDGYYYLSYVLGGGAVGAPSKLPAIVFGNPVNCTIKAGWSNDSLTSVPMPDGGTGPTSITHMGNNCVIQVTASGCSIGINFDNSGTVLPTSTVADLYIMRIDGDAI